MAQKIKRHQKLEVVLHHVESWAKNNTKLVDPLNNVIYASTLDEVDPSKPRSVYEKDKDVDKVKGMG